MSNLVDIHSQVQKAFPVSSAANDVPMTRD
jgi:hypothetical protein